MYKQSRSHAIALLPRTVGGALLAVLVGCSPQTSTEHSTELQSLRAQLKGLSTELRTVRDYQAIRALAERYARALDRQDQAMFREVFWPDAYIGIAAGSGSRDDFIRLTPQLAHSTLAIQHHITTQNVEIDGDTAHMESYLIEFRVSLENEHGVSSYRYLDRLERRNGEWKIAARELISENMAVRMRSPDAFRPSRARRDRSDPSYSRPLKPLRGEQ